MHSSVGEAVAVSVTVSDYIRLFICHQALYKQTMVAWRGYIYYYYNQSILISRTNTFRCTPTIDFLKVIKLVS